MQRSLPILPSLPETRSARSPALLAKGFRPFFLLAGIFAIAIVPLWLLVIGGTIPAPPYLDPVTLHAHEMVFGFVVAVLAGFLLTAVGNWTGRETATGLPLAALTLLWLAGRAAMFLPLALPRAATALVELAFLPVLITVLARPLIATRSRRNFVMLGILAGLFATDVVVHGAALGLLPSRMARPACMVAVDLVMLVIMIIAGRVFPMFTKNATGVQSIRSAPSLDGAAIGAMVAATLSEWIRPDSPVTGTLFVAAGVLAALRSRHWGAFHSLRQPLVWALHAGYAWLCLGLLLRGLALLGYPGLASLATHALTVGAIGGLTLGMMARVSLGHTGRKLVSPAPMVGAFVAINLAAFSRAVVPLLLPQHYFTELVAAGSFWLVAFAVFVAAYAPILTGPRVDGRPG